MLDGNVRDDSLRVTQVGWSRANSEAVMRLSTAVGLVVMALVAGSYPASAQRDAAGERRAVPSISLTRVGIQSRVLHDDAPFGSGRRDARSNLIGGDSVGRGSGRSPIIAGVASAFIPGVGSFYAANPRHGVTHLVIHVVAGTYVLAGSASCMMSWGGETECPDDNLLNVAAVAWLVNWGWSIVSAVNDAKAFNARP